MSTQDLVAAFHTKYGYPRNVDLKILKDKEVAGSEPRILLCQSLLALRVIAVGLRDPATKCLENGDPRPYRVHLMAEELAESVQALLEGDLFRLAHELSDLEYVVAGTFDTFGLPMEKTVAEVHRANMTKTRKDGDARMRDKGNDYEPPDMERVLKGTTT